MGRLHVGWMLRVLACTAALGGCEGVWDGSGSGVVAISAPETGVVVLINVATGARRELGSAGGPFGAITLSPSGGKVVFAREAEVGLDRTLFAADTRSGDTRRMTATTGVHAAQPVWLNDDWFWYPIAIGDAFRTTLVGPGETGGRRMGTNWSVTIQPSPVDDRIAYADCYEQGPLGGRHCLMVERLDGSDPAMLATNISSHSPRFSPDGSVIVYFASVADEMHLWAHPTAGGSPTDLGPAEWPFGEADAVPGGSWFSPDGAEVLLLREGQLVAAGLDGAGARLIADTRVHRAAFTATGDVVYEVMIDANPVPSDTPAYVHSSFVAQASGAVVPLRQNGPECDVLSISDSGAYVGYRCGNGAIHRTSDGTPVVDTGGFYLLGFDRAEEGMVVADFEQVSYAPLDGSAPRELAAYFEGQDAPFYPFDYAP